MSVDFRRQHADGASIVDHLKRCESNFLPSLGSRVEIDAYAKKMAVSADLFEAWMGEDLIGLIAVYCNCMDYAYHTEAVYATRPGCCNP